MWDVEGSVALPEGADIAAVRRRLESDLRLTAHTRIKADEAGILYEVSARRLFMWAGSSVPTVDRVDAGRLRVDGDARRISFQLSMGRMSLWCLSAVPFLVIVELANGRPLWRGVVLGIIAFVVGWVGNQWHVERRVTRYLTSIAGMAAHQRPAKAGISGGPGAR